MVALLTIAIETGMRRSEVIDLRAHQIRRVQGTTYIERPDSKNGRPRLVVLSTVAAASVQALIASLPPKHDGPLIRLSRDSIQRRWRAAREAAQTPGLRLHDLRHEALSRMAGRGLNVGELQAQSGHRTAEILIRYVNARVDEVARKLG